MKLSSVKPAENLLEKKPAEFLGIGQLYKDGLLLSVTFRLGGQFTFGIIYIHTEAYTAFYVGI